MRREKLSLKERKDRGIVKGGKMYKYFYGSRALRYIRKYGYFTNEEGYLMNPRILEEQDEVEQTKESPDEFAYLTK